MRKLIFGINITLDGCCDHTKFGGGDDDDIHEYFGDLMRDADVLIYGRKTYELMVPFWPEVARTNSGPRKAFNDFAKAFHSVKQIVVFSRSMEEMEGGKTSVVRGNLQEEVMKLKQTEGKSILVGGVDLPTQLIELGLVDEFHFVIHPTITGAGRRLMDGVSLVERLQLKLVESKVFSSGCVAVRYVRE